MSYYIPLCHSYQPLIKNPPTLQKKRRCHLRELLFFGQILHLGTPKKSIWDSFSTYEPYHYIITVSPKNDAIIWQDSLSLSPKNNGITIRQDFATIPHPSLLWDSPPQKSNNDWAQVTLGPAAVQPARRCQRCERCGILVGK